MYVIPTLECATESEAEFYAELWRSQSVDGATYCSAYVTSDETGMWYVTRSKRDLH